MYMYIYTHIYMMIIMCIYLYIYIHIYIYICIYVCRWTDSYTYIDCVDTRKNALGTTMQLCLETHIFWIVTHWPHWHEGD